jgi:hypothetical protein
MTLELRELLEHVECPDCKGALTAKPSHGLVSIIVKGKRERWRPHQGCGHIGKYGPGQKIDNEVTVVSPDVQERLQTQVRLIGSKADWNSEDLLSRLEEIWQKRVPIRAEGR